MKNSDFEYIITSPITYLENNVQELKEGLITWKELVRRTQNMIEIHQNWIGRDEA